jgi:hypothetical protein
LNALVRNITKAYEEYDVNAATRPIQAFVDQYRTGIYAAPADVSGRVKAMAIKMQPIRFFIQPW